MLKEMSVHLTENDLVIFCQQVLRFFYGFFFYSVYLENIYMHIHLYIYIIIFYIIYKYI